MFIRYLSNRRRGALCFLICAAVFAVVFALYDIPVLPVMYAAFISLFFIMIFLIFDYRRFCKKAAALDMLKRLPENLADMLSSVAGAEDEDYIDIIRNIAERERLLSDTNAEKLEDITDYYTTWVHQIKTPIASMRLKLQGETSAVSRALSEDLLRIEQYVTMVLTYIRLNNDSSDYVFRLTNIDSIIKKTLRENASQFISRGLSLEYEELGIRAVTDEKWMSFVVEQIISNSLKYTQKGKIRIYCEAPKTLCISDTGIGIAPEDLPLIFEKGYTGLTGREHSRSSGLGLYLCKRICGKLECPISAESKLGEGTTIKIDLEKHSLFE